MYLKPIAHIENDFTDKFGIPRQAGLADVPGRIVFEPEYRRKEAFRGLEGFDYVWLIWEFSEPFAPEAGEERRTEQQDFGMGNADGGGASAEGSENAPKTGWSPTVRPPRLGGNRRMGVFATRSPNRPNRIGLSAVRLERIGEEPECGPVLFVRGADLLNGTPIYDVKPYIPFADSHPDAHAGFSAEHDDYTLRVVFPEELLGEIPAEKRTGLLDILSQDPRPSYQNDPDRIYGLAFGGWNVRFRVDETTLTVVGTEKDPSRK